MSCWITLLARLAREGSRLVNTVPVPEISRAWAPRGGETRLPRDSSRTKLLVLGRVRDEVSESDGICVWLCESNVRALALNFAVAVVDFCLVGLMMLDAEVESVGVVDVLGGGRGLIGLDLTFDLGGARGSSTAMFVSSSSPPVRTTFCLPLPLTSVARPRGLSTSCSSSEPETSFCDFRGRFRVWRTMPTETWERVGETFDLRAGDD
jgi:hypothetical protein